MNDMLQFRAWLVDSEPEIWRTLVLDPRLTLEQLHTVLQIAFGWQNCHMHQFHEEDGRRYTTPVSFDRDFNEGVIDERKICLADVFSECVKSLAYEYDFGDSWIHGVELQARVDPEKIEYPFDTFVTEGRSVFPGKKRAAMCIGGERSGPPEDCGGFHGLDDLLKLRGKPKKSLTPDDREMLEWLDDWDPEAMDLSDINRNLGRVRVKKAFAGR